MFFCTGTFKDERIVTIVKLFFRLLLIINNKISFKNLPTANIFRQSFVHVVHCNCALKFLVLDPKESTLRIISIYYYRRVSCTTF